MATFSNKEMGLEVSPEVEILNRIFSASEVEKLKGTYVRVNTNPDLIGHIPEINLQGIPANETRSTPDPAMSLLLNQGKRNVLVGIYLSENGDFLATVSAQVWKDVAYLEDKAITSVMEELLGKPGLLVKDVSILVKRRGKVERLQHFGKVFGVDLDDIVNKASDIVRTNMAKKSICFTV